MTSEEFGFGAERTTVGAIAKLAAIAVVACAVFVGAMYFVGKANTHEASSLPQPAVTIQTQ
jgi:hypothetical protein